MSDVTPPSADPGFSISPAAAARIAEIVAAQPDSAGLALRVGVDSGGCNGFQYRFQLDRNRASDDIVVERDGARVLVDPVSMDLLGGAQLDFVDKLMGAHFTVSNPNAASSCGCGTSFSLA